MLETHPRTKRRTTFCFSSRQLFVAGLRSRRAIMLCQVWTFSVVLSRDSFRQGCAALSLNYYTRPPRTFASSARKLLSPRPQRIALTLAPVWGPDVILWTRRTDRLPPTVPDFSSSIQVRDKTFPQLEKVLLNVPAKLEKVFVEHASHRWRVL